VMILTGLALQTKIARFFNSTILVENTHPYKKVFIKV